MRAIIIDEERRFSEFFADALMILNFECEHLWDATSALEFFKEKQNVDFDDTIFFVDIGLDVGTDHNTFCRKSTRSVNLTGIRLMEHVIQKKLLSKEQLKKVSLYTSHYTSGNWTEIEKFAKENNLHYFKKSPLLKVADTHLIVREILSR